MNKKELSQLYYLNREIEEQKRRLEELRCEAESCTSRITGLPHAPKSFDRLSKYAAEIADLRGLIEQKKKKCFYELNRLIRFIDAVEDSQMRMILSLRYINGLTWQQIAFSIGGYNSSDGIRKAHDRYLEKI